MKIKDLHIDGFGVWNDLAVNGLPDGMTLFYGPNEAGKTTLMQFVRAMLYGFTPERRQRYLPPVHGGTPGGGMRVTGPGGGYEIRRRAQLTDAGVTGQLLVTGQDGLGQGQHRLSMLLGQIDEAIFTNVFAIGLRELQELNTLDDTSAADELYKLSSGLDRVSLVDVLRQLRGARTELVGQQVDDPEAGRLASLLARREKLRDEVEQLARRTRRYAELAAQRRTQDEEIVASRERLRHWEHEARTLEVASTVRETWLKRRELHAEIDRLQRGLELPDEAPGQLVQIEAQVAERREKLDEVQRSRRELREQAASLPLSRQLLDLQGRIEAAREQATWIEALETQIAKLKEQIERARQRVDEDAAKLGIDEEERQQLIEGGRASLPDLSRTTLAALSAPARAVKQQMFLLRQSRDEGLRDKKEADQLEAKLRESLNQAQADNLQEAMRLQADRIATLRERLQLEEHLEKLRRHFRDLEQEALDLSTAEALPVERTLLLTGPFVFGGLGLLWGMIHFFGWWFVEEPDPQWGMVCMLVGGLCMALWYMGRERGDRRNALDLEDCERQIDTVRKQIREVERQRDDVEARLPQGSGTLETRLREAQSLLEQLESLLPTYHSQQAAAGRYRTARRRASEAAEGLKEARAQWRRTLLSLGLSESMSPSSIRELSSGHERLQSSRRRLEELQAELQQRHRELAALAKRIEALYLEALGDGSAQADPRRQPTAGGTLAGGSRDGSPNREGRSAPSPTGPQEGRAADSDPGAGGRREPIATDRAVAAPAGPTRLRRSPLEQLNHLDEELARQQHWIKRRRELKEQDLQLKRQQASLTRAIERLDQNRRSLWAKCGVATAEQFSELVDRRKRLKGLGDERDAADRQMRSIIGAHVQYDEVIRELEAAQDDSLDRRWTALTTRITQTEDRVGQLQTRQGELAQEMRQLAEDRRLQVAELELECLERQIQSCARRWQMLAMTSCLLEDVCATFEKERQPETLREASSFLTSLTDGRYTRIWTPLGTNLLKVDSHTGEALPLDVLSRGTREAVFIALRLALAAAYARRGVMLPLVLDDVLVNFDRTRALHAARTLQHFAELGHQVLMFTCHDHITEIFQSIGVETRLLPEQGKPGVAEVMVPPEAVHEVETEGEEAVEEEEETVEVELEEVEVEAEIEVEEEAEDVADEIEAASEPDEEPLAEEELEETPSVEAESEAESEALGASEAEPVDPSPLPRVSLHRPQQLRPRSKPRSQPRVRAVPPPEETDEEEAAPTIDWLWYQHDTEGNPWIEAEETESPAAPEEVWNPQGTWWNGATDSSLRRR